MSKGQDSAPETAAGTMDGLLDTARSKGRTKIEGEKPKLIQKQFQQGSDLDRVLTESGRGTRQKLGESEEVRTRDTGTGMDDLFDTSGSGRRVIVQSRSELDDLLSGGGGPRRAVSAARSEMDDLLGPSQGPRRAAPKPVKDEIDPLDVRGGRPKRGAAEPSSLDDLFGPSKRR